MRISAVWYPVSRWQEAKRFYCEVLGLSQTHCDDERGWVAFSTGSGPPLFLVRRPERVGKGGGAVVTLECPDVDALRERLTRTGGRVEEELQEGAGVQIFTFYDPDGNYLKASESCK
jgi:predicted enzyme related to lactoylglutathione lyase